MKRFTTFFLICVLLASLTVAAALNVNNTDIVKENPYKESQGEITYSIDRLSLTNVSGIERSGTFKKMLSMEITVSGDTAFELATPPKIALDENFEHPINISGTKFKNSSDTCRSTDQITSNIPTETTLVIEAYFENEPSTIYVQMPVISTATDITVVEHDVQFSNILIGNKVVDGKDISMFALPFDGETFSVIPRLVTIDANEKIESLSCKVYLDDVGNLTGGYIYFIKPDDFVLADTCCYDVIVNGTFETTEPVIVPVDLT